MTKADLIYQIMTLVEILNQYGFAQKASAWGGLYILFTYTLQRDKNENFRMNGVLIGLIDSNSYVDNDLIRLRSKLNTVLTDIRERSKKEKSKIFL